MKKLIRRDKVVRKKIKELEKRKFILKTIHNNFSFINVIRFNAITQLNRLPTKSSRTFLSNKCVLTVNKNKFNKICNFSRIIFCKLTKKSKIYGVYKLAR